MENLGKIFMLYEHLVIRFRLLKGGKKTAGVQRPLYVRCTVQLQIYKRVEAIIIAWIGRGRPPIDKNKLHSQVI